MINRPKHKFLPKMLKCDPPAESIEKFNRLCREGGLKEYEPEVAKYLGDTRIVQTYFTDQYTHESIIWVYVGDFWWCRKRCWQRVDIAKDKYKKVKKIHYEYARLMAILNDSDSVEYDGIWDCRRHAHKEDPIFVYDLNNDRTKGNIIGWNEFEVQVQFGDKIVNVRDMNFLEFEFVEDFNKFKKIFGLIEKNGKKAGFKV